MNNYNLTMEELQTHIGENVINPSINEEIKMLISSKNKWKKISNFTETIGHILMVGSTIIAFAAGVYNNISSLAFVAGCLNVTSLALLNFSNYASNESNKRNSLLNELLYKINIPPMNISYPTHENNLHELRSNTPIIYS